MPNIERQLHVLLDISEQESEMIQDEIQEVSKRQPIQVERIERIPIQLAKLGFDTDEIITLLDPVSWAAARWLIDPYTAVDRIGPVLLAYRLPAKHAEALLEQVDQIATREDVTATEILVLLEKLAPILTDGGYETAGDTDE